MKTFALKEKRSAPATVGRRPYAHAPFGPVQRAQQERIGRILRSTGAQARLTIGQPNDRYEQEADRVADQVMAMPDPGLQRQPENEEEEETLRTKPLADQITPLVQRQEDSPEEEEEPLQAKFCYGETVQRMCPECEDELAQRQPEENEDEESLQSKEQSGQTPGVTPNIESRINSLKSGGQPLDPPTRSFFEPRFGHDFSDVRLHTDSAAADTARSIHARAFTVGNHVAMGSGEYQPGSQSGQRLLGHELTHVLQQSGPQRSFKKFGVGPVGNTAPLTMRKSYVWPGEEKGQVVRRQAPRRRDPKLLQDFAKKFPAAAALVRKSPEAMKLVRAAAAKGVQFGGYSSRAFNNAGTKGKKVYIPKSWTDKFVVMSGFVFELNNAMRKAKFNAVMRLGKKGLIKAKQYAYRIVALEIEAMLSTGAIWFKMRQGSYKGRAWNKYDKNFYLAAYKAYKSKRKSKDDLIKAALKRTYKTGLFRGWTVEKYYMEQYKNL